MELFVSEWSRKEVSRLQNMYKNCEDSTVWACLDGSNGRIFVNQRNDFSMVALLIGDFLFPNSTENFIENDAENILKEVGQFRMDGSELVIIPQSSDWNQYMCKLPEVSIEKRFSIKKKDVSSFDSEYLLTLTSKLEKGYCLKQIDKKIAEKLLSEEWSRDFCGNFEDVQDFEKRGIGVVIMKDCEIVCGASSYSSYQGGIEVEIATRKEYRNRGLATICSAELILLCKEKGLQVNWDAANLASVKIAEKLGFQFDKEYRTYVMEKRTNIPPVHQETKEEKICL